MNEFDVKLDGMRLVDVGFFMQQIQEIVHTPFLCTIRDMHFIGETKNGFYSNLHFKCKVYHTQNIISTAKNVLCYLVLSNSFK